MIASKFLVIAASCVVGLSSIGLSSVLMDEDIGGANGSSASGGSWKQFLEYVETKEGGTRVNEAGEKDQNGKYYMVENDYAGNPTVGHGLCLYSAGSYLHVDEFQEYNIDSKKAANDWLANGDDPKNNRVEVEICDEIWEKHLKAKYDDIVSTYGHLKLEEYQYYALVDVKYRRGNTDGFAEKYESLWKGANDKYYKKDASKESYSEDSLYSFFWNGGHSLPGVKTRKKEQWLLFKYGYYDTLNEYWEKSQGGSFTKSSGDKVYILGEFTSEITGRKFTLVGQNVTRNGSTLFYQECNRAAGVTILSGYSNKDIEDLIDLGISKGNGFPYDNANLYSGTDLSVINKNDIVGNYKTVKQTMISELKKGNCLMMRFPGYTVGKSGATWASGAGHWISILGYKEENGQDQIFTGDSGHSNNGWFDINEFSNVSIAELKIIEYKK